MRVSGARRRSSAAVCRPDTPGIEMSSTATSGASSTASASASAPFDASPTTVKPGSRLEHVADAGPHDRVVVGDEHADGGRAHGPPRVDRHQHLERARPRPGSDAEPYAPAERADALAHARQSHVPVTLEPLGRARPAARARRPAPAGEAPAGSTDERRPRRSARAACRAHVRQRLLQRAEQGQLRLLREWRERAPGAVKRDPDVAPLAEVGHQRAQRGQQAEVVEQRRPEIVGDAPDAADAGVDQLEGVIEPLRAAPGARRRGAGPAPSSPRRTPARSRRAARARAGGAPPRAARSCGRRAGPARPMRACRRLVEVGVLERGADLLAERHEEAVVERGERIARIAHEHQRADDLRPAAAAAARRRRGMPRRRARASRR